jgi:hypothetical protein
MEPVTLTAAAIATLVITKAFEKTGEILGEKALVAGKSTSGYCGDRRNGWSWKNNHPHTVTCRENLAYFRAQFPSEQ